MLIKAGSNVLNVKTIISIMINKETLEEKSSWWSQSIKKDRYILTMRYICDADGAEYITTIYNENGQRLLDISKEIVSQVKTYDHELVSRAFEEALEQA